MALTKTHICEFWKKAEDFKLKSIYGELVSLEQIKGANGTLVMFICNHCPYVKAIITALGATQQLGSSLGVCFSKS